MKDKLNFNYWSNQLFLSLTPCWWGWAICGDNLLVIIKKPLWLLGKAACPRNYTLHKKVYLQLNVLVSKPADHL